ncbi:uncharacterized protein LOC128170416 [Crassostrea angulata]|uniref:uncharacterized protein LOC128170416 n=1 Tax=Magallana angulata TaxID=2784310 RepID=UPI0022B15513|nr:uncharacterized protein LOC128170416 [Crassostrea angulata]
MSPPEILHSLTLTGVNSCYHVSLVTLDGIWVSDHKSNLIFRDTTSVSTHRVWDLCRDVYGLHTVKNKSELIYIDRNYNINKLSRDMKTRTTILERTDSTWEPRCVYWSRITGDLLVGMYREITECTGKGKVTRYDQIGQLIQTVQHDNTGLELYSGPLYVTENNNEDIVVSDFTAVVVTERGGRHRFTYTGHPSGSELQPHGICTDALSHILLCDDTTKTVQIIDRDGQFLSYLLTESEEIIEPCGINYDVDTHRLWVGSGNNNTVVIYRYITRQDALTDKQTHSPDGEAVSSSTPAMEWK